jgi:hypothetical protein
VLRLLVTATVVPGLLILVTFKMEVIHSSETSVLTRDTRRDILDDGILRSRHRGNLKTWKITVICGRSMDEQKCCSDMLNLLLYIYVNCNPIKSTTEIASRNTHCHFYTRQLLSLLVHQIFTKVAAAV